MQTLINNNSVSLFWKIDYRDPV